MINAAEAFDTAARHALAGEANIAPSVHNIQPTRFRFAEDGAIAVFEDRKRRLPVGDPSGADSWRSLGAASEGLSIALSARGFATNVVWMDVADGGVALRQIARITVAGDAAPDRLRAVVPRRATWRGAFAAKDAAASKGLEVFRETPDLQLVEGRSAVADIARLYDATSLATLRDTAYRLELRSWMRLGRLNGNWCRDGLNAHAMAMSTFEAAGADIVLGERMFPMLDKIGLTGPLIAEGAKVRSAAAIGLFHRPAEEHEFETGRRFYRLWLEITAAGLCLCPMSVLSDTPATATQLKAQHGVDPARKLVNVFRIGMRPAQASQPRRARLPAWDLLV